MFEMLTDYQIWVSLLTLTALEIVLGIDNLIFLSIVSGRLPKHQQQAARRIGLALAPPRTRTKEKRFRYISGQRLDQVNVTVPTVLQQSFNPCKGLN